MIASKLNVTEILVLCDNDSYQDDSVFLINL